MERRTELVPVRFTKKELEYIREQAEQDRLDVSKYIRFHTLGKKEGGKDDKKYMEEIRNLIYEINRIGNNINQIAYRNNSNIYSPTDMQELLDGVSSAREMLYQYLKHLDE
ncbi:MAG: plasmid mobilization relaxosome protein MobC [Lachnospiraceae bacterium]|nr:plasmid mobilization relaxosome protein MobC [Lachnospiraceae bacterium]